MLQPRTAKLYVRPIEETAKAFIKRIYKIRNQDLEVPEDFLNEIHKWSLECELFHLPTIQYCTVGNKKNVPVNISKSEIVLRSAHA